MDNSSVINSDQCRACLQISFFFLFFLCLFCICYFLWFILWFFFFYRSHPLCSLSTEIKLWFILAHFFSLPASVHMSQKYGEKKRKKNKTLKTCTFELNYRCQQLINF
ncbi:hypothetical protein EGW08_016946 [Elysia chlorotica]|uniref:Uncharacterized protein n=1 Tax=Elysia chlorotica TaxID=188477 RepID=A0A3S0ZU13_ELYCH|nr:hypothetical protein EGW08_016946 [Elysia chlorotica]